MFLVSSVSAVFLVFGVFCARLNVFAVLSVSIVFTVLKVFCCVPCV